MAVDVPLRKKDVFSPKLPQLQELYYVYHLLDRFSTDIRHHFEN